MRGHNLGLNGKTRKTTPILSMSSLFSSPGRSPGRAIVLPPASAAVSAVSAVAKC